MVGDLMYTPMIDIEWNQYRNGASSPQKTEAQLVVEEFNHPMGRAFKKHTAYSMS